MDTSLILVKTSKGVEEIKSRSFGLPQTLRALLIMADGSISLASLLSKTAQLPKAEENLSWLIQEGFVESVAPSGRATPATPAAHPQAGQLPPKQMLIAVSRELLGPDAAKVLQRLEDVSDSTPELLAAVDRCYKFIKLTIDEGKAERFLQACRSVLQSGG